MTLPPPKQLLFEHGLRPKHSFGQNFLSDVHLAGKIAGLCTPSGPGRVLEIGAGLGALTSELLALGHSVTAVERDRDLIPVLRTLFHGPIEDGHLSVLEADAKALDWSATLEVEKGGQTIVAGNLPYQITGPLVQKTVLLGRHISRAVFLVQKEVAERLSAPPDSKTYGALSVFVQAQFQVKKAFVIKAGAFYPQPRVDSAVVVLSPLESPVHQEDLAFRQIVKSAFAARRKTLKNAWRSLLPREELMALAEEVDISLDARGETLTVEQFGRAARSFAERKGGT